LTTQDPKKTADTESDSLGGFIVSGYEIKSDDPKPHFSEEESYFEDGAKWEFEAEMLADFGKSSALIKCCM
jgi:hypothetical protein